MEYYRVLIGDCFDSFAGNSSSLALDESRRLVGCFGVWIDPGQAWNRFF